MELSRLEGPNRPATVINIEDFRGREFFRSNSMAFIFISHLDYISSVNSRSNHASQFGKVSISNYFIGIDNPLNKTALDIVPIFEGESLYDRSGLKSIIKATGTGDSPESLIKKSLELDSVSLSNSILRFIDSPKKADLNDRISKFLKECDRYGIAIFDIIEEFNLNAVMNKQEMEDFVKRSGYSDFLDYLMDLMYKIKQRSQNLNLD